jgi:hypothetical protein
MRASGGRSTEAVPSDHGFLKSSLTAPSGRMCSRSLASGGYFRTVDSPFLEKRLHASRRTMWHALCSTARRERPADVAAFAATIHQTRS